MRAILAATLVLLLLPFVAAAPASAHIQSCNADDAVCVARCHTGHTEIGVHECRILWPFALDAMTAPRGGDARAVLV